MDDKEKSVSGDMSDERDGHCRECGAYVSQSDRVSLTMFGGRDDGELYHADNGACGPIYIEQ